jgi:hypothetical protein
MDRWQGADSGRAQLKFRGRLSLRNLSAIASPPTYQVEISPIPWTWKIAGLRFRPLFMRVKKFCLPPVSHLRSPRFAVHVPLKIAPSCRSRKIEKGTPSGFRRTLTVYRASCKTSSCFRYWEARSLGDLEKTSKNLRNSKTPFLPAAKANTADLMEPRGFASASINSENECGRCVGGAKMNTLTVYKL